MTCGIYVVLKGSETINHDYRLFLDLLSTCMWFLDFFLDLKVWWGFDLGEKFQHDVLLRGEEFNVLVFQWLDLLLMTLGILD